MLMYISQNVSYKFGTDLLNIYIAEELELTFVEVLAPNKPGYIVGAVYKHPPMKLRKFNNFFLKHFF